MKIIRKHPLILKAFFVVVCLCFYNIGMAQFDLPPDPCPDPKFPCPIDGGLSLLIAAGIGIGAKKAYDANKNKKQSFKNL